MNDTCKNCHRQIPHYSIYCNWCGAKQINDVNVVPVPMPKKVKAGYSGQIMVDGKRVTVHGKTEQEYYKKARELKAKKDSFNAPIKNEKLSVVLNNYIDKNSNVLSPSSVRGYRIMARNRFLDYHDEKVDKIDYQRMINDEILLCSPKTLKSAWGLVKSALNDYGYTPQKVRLPQIPVKEQQFFDEEQTRKFLEVIKGNEYECIYLLALHSLRLSEIKGLSPSDVTEDGIKVSGAVVPDENNKQVKKKTNKNTTSTRTIPILIPRLLEVAPQLESALPQHEQTWRKHLAGICEQNDLPVLTMHDLRRTFATVAYSCGVSERVLCQLAGWQINSQTVHKIYVQLTKSQINTDVEKIRKAFE